MRRGVALRNLRTGGFGQAGRITRQGLRFRTHDKARPAYGYVPVERVHIMRDHEASRRARLTSCEHLLGYECPSEVIDEAKAVLMSIVEDSETLIDTKLDALKLLRRVEARRVSPGRATREGKIEIKRALELLRRRNALLRAGITSFSKGYADDLMSDSYVPLPD